MTGLALQPSERCYACKRELARLIGQVAAGRRRDRVVEGESR